MPDCSAGSHPLVVHAEFGLANRLMALLSALVLTEALDLRLTVVWKPGDAPECSARLPDLFDTGTLGSFPVLEDAGVFSGWLAAETLSGTQLQKLLATADGPVCLRAHSFFGYDALPGFTFHEKVRQKLHALRPSEPVRRLMEATPQPLVGLHARFTDHLPCHVLTPRWCYRAAIDLLGRQFPSAAVLVCSDTPGFARELQARAPSTVVLAPSLRGDTVASRGTVEGMHAALADLWMLANCRVIIGSPASTFAAIAGALGGAREHRLASSAVLTTARAVAAIWAISRSVRFDWSRFRWRRDPEKRGGRNGVFAALAAAVGAVVARSGYQDHPLPLQRGGLRRRFARFFAQHAALLEVTPSSPQPRSG